MNVLLVESSVGAGVDIEAALTRHGHVVYKCFSTDDGPPGRCVELSGGRCPLRAHPGTVSPTIDVLVDVRTTTRSRPTLTESGLACAFGASVPIVVVADHAAQLRSPAVARAVPIDADAVLAAIDDVTRHDGA